MRTVTTKLPEKLDRALRALAKRRGASLSAVVREALELFTRERCGSFDSRASDLAGCLEGPPDLSRSRKHMEGYGR